MPGDPDWVALGQPQNLVFAGSQDRQIHVVPSPHYARGRFATLWGWAQPTGRQNPVLNEFVCKTGQTTSSTCWNVANINVSIPQNPPVYPSAMNNLFEGNNLGGPTYVSCAGGDSGGPIWNGNVRAVGIVHGASGNAGLPHVCIGAKILAQIPNGWEIGT